VAAEFKKTTKGLNITRQFKQKDSAGKVRPNDTTKYYPVGNAYRQYDRRCRYDLKTPS
jgi:hypothetical protein